MTKLIIPIIAIAGIVALCSCTTVKEREPTSRTTSTTESSTIRPATTETQTVRSY